MAIQALDGQAETYTLITPGWANYDNPGYEITNFDYYEDEGWILEINIEDVGDFTWYSNNSESDTNLTFDLGYGYETFGPAYATKTTTAKNALGLAMLSDVSEVENQLSNYATKADLSSSLGDIETILNAL